jgi:hypothetical protein
MSTRSQVSIESIVGHLVDSPTDTICANGPRQQSELRPLSTTWEELPEGTFVDQGTGVRAALFTVRR